MFFFIYQEQNYCYKILMTEDIMRRTTDCYIEFFFHHMSSMSDQLDSANIRKTIFYNKNFLSMISMMDTLIANIDRYKEKFYNFLTKRLEKEVIQIGQRKTLRTIFRLHELLFHFCLYKTFLNEDWKEAFEYYYVISIFIQDMMENNFYKFKKWFSFNNFIKKKKV